MQEVIELLRLMLDPGQQAIENRKQRVDALHAAIRAQTPHVLATRLGLAESEMNVVWLMAAIGVDPDPAAGRVARADDER